MIPIAEAQWVARLLKAAALGQPVDLRPPPKPNVYNTDADADTWEPDRLIPVGAIRAAILHPEFKPDPQGIRIIGARLTGGRLDLEGVSVPCSIALVDCYVDRGVYALRSIIKGELDLGGSSLHGLHLGQASVEGRLNLYGTTVFGEASFQGVQISGGLCGIGFGVRDDPHARAHGAALCAFHFATIREGMRLDDAYFAGDLLLGYAVMDVLHMVGTRICGDFNANDMTVSGMAEIALANQPAGVYLAGAALGTLSLPTYACAYYGPLPRLGTGSAEFLLRGFTVSTVEGLLLGSRKATAAWLSSQSTFSPQPWHEMASVYERRGQSSEARWLRWQAARRATRHTPWRYRCIRWLYGALAGYGYYPLIAGAWLLIVLASSGVLVATHKAAFEPTVPWAAYQTAPATPKSRPPAPPIEVTGASPCRAVPRPQPCFAPALYALDSVLPAVGGGQTTSWRIRSGGWLPGALTALKVGAWLTTVLLLAGISGLLRKA